MQFQCAYSEMYSLIYAFIKSLMKWSFETLLGLNLYSRCICLRFVWHIRETVSHCGLFPTHAQRNRSIFVSQMYAAHITMSWCTFYVCLDAYLRKQSVMVTLETFSERSRVMKALALCKLQFQLSCLAFRLKSQSEAPACIPVHWLVLNSNPAPNRQH